MTAPPDAVFIGLRGVNYFRADIGDKVFIPLDGPTMQAAIAAARAEGREQGLREAAGACDAISAARGASGTPTSIASKWLAASCRDAILALIPAPPADGGDNG